jgi:hypothetical protein
MSRAVAMFVPGATFGFGGLLIGGIFGGALGFTFGIAFGALVDMREGER